MKNEGPACAEETGNLTCIGMFWDRVKLDKNLHDAGIYLEGFL
jgi:hypothetical protein